MKPKWSRLDNVAKIYPASSTKTDTHVFRFSCELYDPVSEEVLQRALDDTIKVFPVYQYILKRGLFWYYLESTSLRPIVRMEYKPPCSELYDRNQKTLLYEVTYFGNTVNLEVYHVLTDGTGAINFFKILITKYLSMIHGIDEPEAEYDASHTQMADDSFKRYYDSEGKVKKKKQKNSYQIKGTKYSENRIKIIRGTLSVKEALRAARENNATITTLFAACFLYALHEDQIRHQHQHPIVLSIPVNLRNYFESESARNFFANIFTEYDFEHGKNDIADIIVKVNDDFKREVTLENLGATLNSFYAVERNLFIRMSPLWFKDIVLKVAYNIQAKKSTAILSNVGIVKLPDEISEYVRSFDVCTGTNRMQACVCSCGDRLSISFTSPFVNSDVQRIFFRTLSEYGIGIELASNVLDEE